MGSVGSLRTALFLQAALTAGWGLLRSGGGAWTILTMVVAAAAVFVGAALQPTADWRTGLLGFEALAVLYGVLGLPAHHVVPATLLAVAVLALTLTQGAALAFAGAPLATLSGLGMPVSEAPVLPGSLVGPAFFASPCVVEEPPVLALPVVLAQSVVAAPATRAPASMTILPQR